MKPQAEISHPARAPPHRLDRLWSSQDLFDKGRPDIAHGRAPRVVLGQVFARHTQHAARAGRRVVERPHDPLLAQDLVVLDEDQPHRVVVDGIRMQVDAGEFLRDLAQQARHRQPLHLRLEVAVLEAVADPGRETLDVFLEVLADVVLVPHELLQVQGRGVVELQGGPAAQVGVRVDAGLPAGGRLGQAFLLGGVEDAIQAPEDGERQDDLAVLGLLVVPRRRSATDQMKAESAC